MRADWMFGLHCDPESRGLVLERNAHFPTGYKRRIPFCRMDWLPSGHFTLLCELEEKSSGYFYVEPL